MYFVGFMIRVLIVYHYYRVSRTK